MKRIILLAASLILFLIQSALLSRFPIWNNVIPLLFTFGLASSIYEDRWDALILGLFTGFLIDIYSPHLFGINMLLNMWTYVAAWKISGYLRRDNKILMVIFMAAAAFTRYTAQYLVMKLAGIPADFKSVGVLTLMVLLISHFSILIYRRVTEPPRRRRRRRFRPGI